MIYLRPVIIFLFVFLYAIKQIIQPAGKVQRDKGSNPTQNMDLQSEVYIKPVLWTELNLLCYSTRGQNKPPSGS